MTSLSPCTPSGEENWLALAIGNSQLHWAWFVGEALQRDWDTPHSDRDRAQQRIGAWNRGYLWPKSAPCGDAPVGEWVGEPPALWIASVVPQQLDLWREYGRGRIITRDEVPLQGMYPSFGIDRALAVVGAGHQWGWPCLAIDAGTALTFTGADDRQRLVGGAILPGFALQLQSLSQKTAALPEIEIPAQLPSRWATETAGAIQSGVVYSIVAGVRDFIENWWQQFPEATVAIAGGGGRRLVKYLQVQAPEIAQEAIADPHLIFWGMRLVKRRQSAKP
ncbi:pantothenate kinase [Phormidium sp. CCY1219]|uniref:pantothenate kinase n=1 Tax=Phormidium sp. CCY1219 TaxID=2886104 RepID=UPI002D1EB82B|nr:pantothenate kinase [Phormidium sp. CCY1219]MEB3830284.1 pantothenate kinase [Phormidium sp. CCY1219]